MNESSDSNNGRFKVQKAVSRPILSIMHKQVCILRVYVLYCGGLRGLKRSFCFTFSLVFQPFLHKKWAGIRKATTKTFETPEDVRGRTNAHANS